MTSIKGDVKLSQFEQAKSMLLNTKIFVLEHFLSSYTLQGEVVESMYG